MKMIITAVREWWKSQQRAMRRNRMERKLQHLIEESEQVIQVREYDGKVWLSYGGMPLFAQDDLVFDFALALQSARSAWIAYNMGERTPDVEKAS